MQILRDKMKSDPLFSGRNLTHASKVTDYLIDSYLQKDWCEHFAVCTIKKIVREGHLDDILAKIIGDSN